jgi:hypothetical protein
LFRAAVGRSAATAPRKDAGAGCDPNARALAILTLGASRSFEQLD